MPTLLAQAYGYARALTRDRYEAMNFAVRVVEEHGEDLASVDLAVEFTAFRTAKRTELSACPEAPRLGE